MNHREAAHTDLQTIKELLNISKLPSEDCEEHIGNFMVIEEKEKIVGVGGLEICGAIGLVRSIAVAPEHRGKGVAKQIYKSIENKAHGLGINTLYLLTESTAEYFKKLGFIIQERSEAPLSVMETKQFKELCPSSAKVMYRKIS